MKFSLRYNKSLNYNSIQEISPIAYQDGESVMTRKVAAVNDGDIGTTVNWLSQGLTKWEQLKNLFTTLKQIDSESANAQPAIDALTACIETCSDYVGEVPSNVTTELEDLGFKTFDELANALRELDGLTVTLPSGDITKVFVIRTGEQLNIIINGAQIGKFVSTADEKVAILVPSLSDFLPLYQVYDKTLAAYQDTANMYFVMKKTCELALSNATATASEYAAYLSQYSSRLRGDALNFYETMKDTISQAGNCNPSVVLSVFDYFMSQLRDGVTEKDDFSLSFNTEDYEICTSFIPTLKDVAATAFTVISAITSIAFGAAGMLTTSIIGGVVNIISSLKDNSESTNFRINEDAAINAYARPFYQQVLKGDNSDCVDIIIPAIQASDSGYLSINVPGLMFHFWLTPSNRPSYKYDVCFEMYLSPTLFYSSPSQLTKFFGIWHQGDGQQPPLMTPGVDSYSLDGSSLVYPKLSLGIPTRTQAVNWFFYGQSRSETGSTPEFLPISSASTSDLIRALRSSCAVILWWMLIRTANQHNISTVYAQWNPNLSMNGGWYSTYYRAKEHVTSSSSWQATCDHIFANFVCALGTWSISETERNLYWNIQDTGVYNPYYEPFWQLIYDEPGIIIWKNRHPNMSVGFSRLPGSFSIGTTPWPTLEDELFVHRMMDSIVEQVSDMPAKSTNLLNPTRIDGAWVSFNWLIYDSINAYTNFGNVAVVVYGYTPLSTSSFSVLPPQFSSSYWVGVAAFGLVIAAVAATAFLIKTRINQKMALRAVKRQSIVDSNRAKLINDPNNKELERQYLKSAKRYNRIADKVYGSCYSSMPSSGSSISNQNGSTSTNNVYSPIVYKIKQKVGQDTDVNDDLSLYDIATLIIGD